MTNITGVLQESMGLFDSPDMTVDLSGVTDVDSSAVSLLLEWRRTARAANRTIHFANLPANLRTLADLYGVADLLGAIT